MTLLKTLYREHGRLQRRSAVMFLQRPRRTTSATEARKGPWRTLTNQRRRKWLQTTRFQEWEEWVVPQGHYQRNSRSQMAWLDSLLEEEANKSLACSKSLDVRYRLRRTVEVCPDRSVTLTGGPESIQAAKRLLTEIVEKGRPAPAFNHNDGPGTSVQEIMIPATKAGLVIGKGGETIKGLQERAGVKMVMIQDGPQNTGADKPLRISGEPFKVQQAKEMVMELIRDQGFREQRGEYGSRVGGGHGGGGNGGGGNGGGNGGDGGGGNGGDSLDVPVPRFAVGIVIGRNGEMIKKIQNDTGVRIQFKPDDGTPPERIAQIMGPPRPGAACSRNHFRPAQERSGWRAPRRTRRGPRAWPRARELEHGPPWWPAGVHLHCPNHEDRPHHRKGR
ncbi:hypothetical protein CesoFtcFv8_015405 [Champsocephalus esox]|uniref:K Homology domain-containing protein n=1 Tax=Champsocephalus esox TaxID=159716 RepID=A0AAN8BQR0_9TELE|nr:hypothetical protein CesoFtcFv8_015405 [Champsocephalus esox]